VGRAGCDHAHVAAVFVVLGSPCNVMTIKKSTFAAYSVLGRCAYDLMLGHWECQKRSLVKVGPSLDRGPKCTCVGLHYFKWAYMLCRNR
jgi:hypothetical protein